MDTKQNMLMKVASLDKSASLVARIAFANSMTKVANKVALQDYMEKVAAGEKGSFADSLNNAWQGIQDWWSKPENQAGLATGALSGLATYGLTGLIPGLKNNQLARLGLAAGGLYGGYKGGQWGAKNLFNNGAEAGINAVAEQQAAQDRADDNAAQSAAMAQKALVDQSVANAQGSAGVAAANATAQAAKDKDFNDTNDALYQKFLQDQADANVAGATAVGNAKLDQAAAAQKALQGQLDEQTAKALAAQQAYDANLARVQGDLDAANAQNAQLKDDMKRSGQAETLRLAARGKSIDDKQRAESEAMLKDNYKKSIDTMVSDIAAAAKKAGGLTKDEYRAYSAQLDAEYRATDDPDKKNWLIAADKALQSLVKEEKARPTMPTISLPHPERKLK